MSESSTIPAVKQALFDLLAARPGLAGVQVAWAQPSPDATQQDAIWFEGTTSNQKAEALGNLRRDETYVMELVVSVLRDGDTARAAELRMWEICGEIEDTVRENPKPIPAPLFDIQFSVANQHPSQAEGQRISDVLVRIAARARI